MHPTEPRLSLRLSYRRAETVGFWIIGTLLWSLAVAGAAAALGAAAPWTWAAAGAALLMLPRAGWREWFQAGVWGWNTTVRLVAPALRRYVLAVCYYTLFSAVGISGSMMDLTSGGASSGWRPTPRPAPPGGADPRSEAHGSGHQGLLDAARRMNAPWVVFLLPLIFLLRLLSDEARDNTPPGNTYTLY
jgi:NAD(P)-dependent dehydrogenase (short-subunit alcohol dehydrogenase family)